MGAEVEGGHGGHSSMQSRPSRCVLPAPSDYECVVRVQGVVYLDIMES